MGLRVDLRAFYAMAKERAKIRALAQRFIGFRPPRFPSLFEAIVNAIACQQLSLTVGIILLNRLARTHGTGSFAGQAPLAFALPEQVAKLHPEQLGELGFSRQKAQALIAIANRLSNCSDRLDNLLRGLGRLGVFPADDIAGQKNLYR